MNKQTESLITLLEECTFSRVRESSTLSTPICQRQLGNKMAQCYEFQACTQCVLDTRVSILKTVEIIRSNS